MHPTEVIELIVVGVVIAVIIIITLGWFSKTNQK
ncbi:nitrogen fixation-related uncharacterized protein [Metabacillus crassostreae]|nr:nitrogen fixation-related uncharacterized protein [Metabacillus crassostreae]